MNKLGIAANCEMNQYDGGRGQATSLLAHYFKVVFEASGLNWNSDNEAEIKNLVDCIIDESQTEGCDPMEMHPLSPYGLK